MLRLYDHPISESVVCFIESLGSIALTCCYNSFDQPPCLFSRSYLILILGICKKKAIPDRMDYVLERPHGVMGQDVSNASTRFMIIGNESRESVLILMSLVISFLRD